MECADACFNAWMGNAIREPVTGWRWVGRGAVVLLLVIGVTAAVWGVWWRVAHQRMDAVLAELREQGKTVRWQDVVIDDVPDEENAALLYTAATGPDWLESVRKARGLKRSLNIPRAELSKRDPWGMPAMPRLADRSILAKAIKAEALKEHVNGDEREAVELVRDIGRLARSSASEPLLLIGGVVGQIVDHSGVDAIGEMALTIRIGDEGLKAEEVRQLIPEVLDDLPLRKTLAEGFGRERLNGTNLYLANQPGVSGALLYPMLIDLFRKNTMILETVAEDVERLRRTMPVGRVEEDVLWGIVAQIPDLSKDVIDLCIRRRMAGAVLAVQLYRHEHGAFPQRMEELVPQYLPTVPEDPRAAGAVMGYVLEADGRRPILYMPGGPAPTADGLRGAIKIGPMPLPSGTIRPGLFMIDASAWQTPSTQPATDRGVDQP